MPVYQVRTHLNEDKADGSRSFNNFYDLDTADEETEEIGNEVVRLRLLEAINLNLFSLADSLERIAKHFEPPTPGR